MKNLLNKINLNGVFPPIVTSFTKQGEIDQDQMSFNIKKWNQFPLKGLVVFGSNGEYPYLTSDEKIAVLDRVIKTARNDMTIIAGTGCESTGETIDMTNRAAEKGAHVALIITPYYYSGAMSELALAHHFKSVADQSNIPILIYNVPKFTGINTSVSLIEELSQHTNIIGMKDSTGNVSQLAEILERTPDDFNTLVGTAGAFMGALALGCTGGIMALANIAPAECVTLQELLAKGDISAASELQRRLAPVNTAITATYGVAGLKAAMDILGYYGGPPRLPMQPATAETKENIRTILSNAALI